jgi:uncharacterized membrane protein YqhA
MSKLLVAAFSLRYLALLAIIAPFFGAALMFLFGTLNTIEAYLIFFGLQESEGTIEPGEQAMITLVASIDHFLFATVLIVFAIGLYSLFFRTTGSGKEQKEHAKRASWNRLKNLGGMDEMLLKVIIMLLSVAFLEFMLNAGLGSLDWQVLVVPFTIIALAVGLRWMSAASDDRDTKQEEVELQIVKLDELERLSTLHKDGAITESEFKLLKKTLLPIATPQEKKDA